MEIIKPRTVAMYEGQINKTSEPFSIRAKQFYAVEAAASLLSEKFSKQLCHEPDGLIFQPSLDVSKLHFIRCTKTLWYFNYFILIIN